MCTQNLIFMTICTLRNNVELNGTKYTDRTMQPLKNNANIEQKIPRVQLHKTNKLFDN